MQIITNKTQKELKAHGNYQFPLLVSPECLSQYEAGSFLWHWHPEIELTLIRDGRMLYQVNNHTFELRQGQGLFVNSGALHTGRMIEHKDCRYMSITFDPKLVYGFENSLIYEKYVKPLTQNPALAAIPFELTEGWHGEAVTVIRQIISIHEQQGPAAELDIVGKLQELWKLLCLHISTAPAHSPHELVSYARLRTILDYIGARYTDKITLSEIADNVHLCTSECSRLFRRYMNQSLFEFILEYRIEKSLPLLANPEFSITEIAANTGFNDSNYYSKVFLKVKGCAPTQYRKRLNRDTAAQQPQA